MLAPPLQAKYGDTFARIAGTDDREQTYIIVEPAQSNDRHR